MNTCLSYTYFNISVILLYIITAQNYDGNSKTSKNIIAENAKLFRRAASSGNLTNPQIVSLEAFDVEDATIIKKKTAISKTERTKNTIMVLKLKVLIKGTKIDNLNDVYFLISPAIDISKKVKLKKWNLILPLLPNYVRCLRNKAGYLFFQLTGLSVYYSDYAFKLALNEQNSEDLFRIVNRILTKG